MLYGIKLVLLLLGLMLFIDGRALGKSTHSLLSPSINGTQSFQYLKEMRICEN